MKDHEILNKEELTPGEALFFGIAAPIALVLFIGFVGCLFGA